MKRVIVIAMLFLLSGCGGDDGGGADNCRWVRFIPEQGDWYYEYVCDDNPAGVRYVQGVPK